MSGFSPEWLALREEADGRSRAPGLAAALGAWATAGETLHVLDLGCGTGANLRWLAPRLPVRQAWRLLDVDETVLGGVARALSAWAEASARPVRRTAHGLRLGDALEVSWQRLDLAGEPLPLGAASRGPQLVTASALADLVSRAWLRRLVQRCAACRAALLLALSYDGRLAFTPAREGDRTLRAAINQHQLGDKGFGPALGPDATAAATTLLRAHGYRVVQARSDWRLGRSDRELQQALLEGWIEPASRRWRGDAPPLERWVESRVGLVSRPDAFLRVGHVDLLALPPRPS